MDAEEGGGIGEDAWLEEGSIWEIGLLISVFMGVGATMVVGKQGPIK
jgi:hypothetical protein